MGAIVESVPGNKKDRIPQDTRVDCLHLSVPPNRARMACSGINEHKEGCRKQRVLDRAAASRRLMMEMSCEEKSDILAAQMALSDPNAPGYMRKMGSPPGMGHDSYARECQDKGVIDLDGSHSPTAVDRLRRQGVREQQLVAYSAKLPKRLSSVNYTQQW